MKAEHIEKLTKFIAETCIGPSTIRNMGKKGSVIKVRKYLSGINIEHFFDALKDEKSYQIFLNGHTNKLKRKANFKESGWGPARKCLNIYLRTVCYNAYIPAYYKLHPGSSNYDKSVKYLELPLDSSVANNLKSAVNKQGLKIQLPSRWPGVIHLKEVDSKCYQEAAKQIAASEKIIPVHLDLFYYRSEKQK